jgi:hypothetical protein
VLVGWAAGAGAAVTAVDPAPQPDLEALEGVELIRRTSLAALREIPLPDAIVIDGDHNYFTVSEELRLIAGRAEGGLLPLLLFHDVCWPHGRRDDYHDAGALPADARHAVADGCGGLFPGDPGVRADGLPYPRSAAHEGGARNGVLTAIEDFVAEHERLRLAVVPVFFGFGAVWPLDAPWSDAVAAHLAPWDRHPVLERLEANRVLHIAREFELAQRAARQEAVLGRMLESSAFRVAERLSKLRVRAGIAPGQSVISREEIRRALRAGGR